jgi:hypothetical protein
MSGAGFQKKCMVRGYFGIECPHVKNSAWR